MITDVRTSLFVLATSLLTLVAVAGPANADPAPTGVTRAMGYYLALGDSLAAGYQPDRGDDKLGGYVGGTLAAITAAKTRRQPIRLMTQKGDLYRTVDLAYYDGMRYPTLERTGGGSSSLDRLLSAK